MKSIKNLDYRYVLPSVFTFNTLGVSILFPFLIGLLYFLTLFTFI